MAKLKKISRVKIKKATEQFSDSVENYSEKERTKVVDPLKLVPTGSTTFNLECSGRIEGAFKLGKLINLIGDSHAGKTLFALTVFAECSLDPRFDDFRFIFDDVEAANEFDLTYLFGKRVANRIELDIRSRTIEDLNDNIARALEGEEQFIYVLDSFDALTSEAAIDKDKDNRKKREKGNDTTGSYGDGKAKMASSMFSQRTQDLADHESLLIVISQTRDNIGFGARFTPKVRSGGKALKFYAAHEIWLACQKREKKGKRTIITNVQAKITKNKLTGRHGEATFPILFDYGVDNITSCIIFMVEEGNWTGSKKSINSKDFAEKMKLSALVEYIEDNNLEDELFDLCQETYDNVMEKLRTNRKRKY